MNVNLELSGLYSSLFVILFSLIFQKNFGGGRKQKRAADCQMADTDSKKYSHPNISLRLRTSRERPKSAPYLRLKKTRKPLFLQLETTKALKKLKIEKKKFPNFF